MDSTSGLTQVLGEFGPDDDIYYLLGLDIIGQQQGTDWTYFAHDALGSAQRPAWASPVSTPIPPGWCICVRDSTFLTMDPVGGVVGERSVRWKM